MSITVIAGVQHRRRARFPHHCPSCNYDVSGLPPRSPCGSGSPGGGDGPDWCLGAGR